MKKKMKKYGKGGAYKSVPAGNKGLGKLPKAVRNKMGYKQMGGASMDMSDPLVDAMRGKKGKEIKKPMYKMGGWTSYKK